MKIKIAYEKVLKALWWLTAISHLTTILSFAGIVAMIVFDYDLATHLGAVRLARLGDLLLYSFLISAVTMFISNCLYANMFPSKHWRTVANIGIFYTTLLIMLLCARYWDLLPSSFPEDNLILTIFLLLLAAYYAGSIAVLGVAQSHRRIIKLTRVITIITMIANFLFFVGGFGVLNRSPELSDTQVIALLIGIAASVTFFFGDTLGLIIIRWSTRHNLPATSSFTNKEIVNLRRRLRRCITLPTIAIIVVNLIGLGKYLSNQKMNQSQAVSSPADPALVAPPKTTTDSHLSDTVISQNPDATASNSTVATMAAVTATPASASAQSQADMAQMQ